VTKLLEKDVIDGFSIPIPINIVAEIPQSAMQPLRLASQWALNEDGVRILKFRMTKDLSFLSSKEKVFHGPSIAESTCLRMLK
jgi:hypothetical protein